MYVYTHAQTDRVGGCGVGVVCVKLLDLGV